VRHDHAGCCRKRGNATYFDSLTTLDVFLSCLPNDSTKISFKLQKRANKDGLPLHTDNGF
jgi:hypothetical protein